MAQDTLIVKFYVSWYCLYMRSEIKYHSSLFKYEERKFEHFICNSFYATRALNVQCIYFYKLLVLHM
jgi:hypothetical protein